MIPSKAGEGTSSVEQLLLLAQLPRALPHPRYSSASARSPLAPWRAPSLPSSSHQQQYCPDVQPELCSSLGSECAHIRGVQAKMLLPGRTKGNISTGSEKNSWLKTIKPQNSPWEELLSMRTWKPLEPGSSSHAETALAWPLNQQRKQSRALLCALQGLRASPRGVLASPSATSAPHHENQLI